MNPFGLDSQVLAFIRETESFSDDVPADAPVPDVRAAYDRMCIAFTRPYPAGLRATDGILHARNPARDLRLRHYTPADAIADRVVLYFHGGGFVLGGIASHDSICADLAARAEVTVTALDYRLSPEHRYPAALDDAEAAYDDLLASHQAVILAGDSAGGTLAAALCLRLRRKGKPMPRAQVLIYPGLHPNCMRAIDSAKAEAPLLPAASLAGYRSLYTGAPPQVTEDPELAPLAARDFSGLPPTAIFVADIDPLADDSHDYAAALKACGVPVTLHPGVGLVHGYLRGRTASDRIAAAFSAIVSALHGFAQSGHF